MLSLLTTILTAFSLQQEPVQTTSADRATDAETPTDLCDVNLCRDARDVLFMVDGEMRAAPIPITRSPYLIDDRSIILAPREQVRLKLTGQPVEDGQILTFDLIDAGLVDENMDHATGNLGELLLVFTLDNVSETARLELTNYTGHDLTYALSLISVAGHPYNVETCMTADRDRFVMETNGQVFSYLINDIRIAGENADCRYYGTNPYPLLGG